MTSNPAQERRDDDIVRGLSEAILANVLAMRQAGIAPDAIKVAVGPDGGAVLGGGKVLQTPVTHRLPDFLAERLLNAVGQLLDAVDEQRIPAGDLDRIAAANNVAHKVLVILGEPKGNAPA